MILTSNQNSVHQDLEKIVLKHLKANYKKPIADYNRIAFENLFLKIELIKLPIILDSGCGTGLSTINLSKKYPEHLIIGVDKSENRLGKIPIQNNDRIIFCRADLIDFWQLALESKLKIDEHYVLYPNPWPKKKHIMRRWHGHPIFPIILKLGKSLTIRSDWDIYIDEFELALKLAGLNNTIKQRLNVVNAISAFEQKYIIQGRKLYELNVSLL